MTAPVLRSALLSGAADLGVELSETQIGQLLDFVALLGKWNKVYNLTAVRDPAEMLIHHLLDSLAAVPPLRRYMQTQAAAGRNVSTLLDVGSGGGLPGVVLAVCIPALSVQCVDAVAKKAAFLQQAAVHLGLGNLTGLHTRVESLDGPFDIVCSRAFASLQDFTVWSRKALSPHGVWLAMKGKKPLDEVAALPPDVEVFHVEPLHVPGLDAERCIVWLRPSIPHVN